MAVSVATQESWNNLNRLAMLAGGGVISPMYAVPATVQAPLDSTLPDDLIAQGYGVRRTGERPWLDAAATSEVMTHKLEDKEYTLRTITHAGNVMRATYEVTLPHEAMKAPAWEVLPFHMTDLFRRKRGRR